MKQNFQLLFLKNNFSKPVQSVKISRMRSESFARTDTDRKHSNYRKGGEKHVAFSTFPRLVPKCLSEFRTAHSVTTTQGPETSWW